MLNTTPRLILAGLAAATLTPFAAAHPDHPEDGAKLVHVEPVRDAARAGEIIDAEREHLPKPALSIGMKAPELAIAEWVKGDSVQHLGHGRTHVVEFWATWCGPCIRAFPHMSELQKEHADDVTFIGVNIWDRKQNRETGEFTEEMPTFIERIDEFVEEQGEKMGYTVAIEESGKMAETWMRAAGRNGIPCAFIVDDSGKVAWIGHPMSMVEPLEQITEGEWDYDKAAKDYTAELETGYWYQHLMGLLTDEATAERGYTLAYALLRTPLAENPQLLNAISWNMLTSEQIPARDRDAAIVLASVACEKTKWENPSVIDTLARGYFDKGEHAKAVELQAKAVEAAGETPMAGDLKATLEKYKAAATD